MSVFYNTMSCCHSSTYYHFSRNHSNALPYLNGYDWGQAFYSMRTEFLRWLMWSHCPMECDRRVPDQLTAWHQSVVAMTAGRVAILCHVRPGTRGYVTIEVISLKLILNSNLMKTSSSITSISVVKSFWNFAQSTAVSLPCSVQSIKMIWCLTNMLWT